MRNGRHRILLLGGTTEASLLAALLDAALPAGSVVTSLAGRTAHPNPIAGEVRIGGFGGIDGFATWLTEEVATAVIDATHPFAAVMPWHVAAACERLHIPRLRLRRPGWVPGPGARWTIVPDYRVAVATLSAWGARRILLTVGRQEIEPFADLDVEKLLLRSIDPPDTLPTPNTEVLLARGPFTLPGEKTLMDEHHIDALVTKNSGGNAAAAKLEAARTLGIPVVMVSRPASPPGQTATTVDQARSWVLDAVEP